MGRSAEKSSNLTRADGYRYRKSLLGVGQEALTMLVAPLKHLQPARFGRAPALAPTKAYAGKDPLSPPSQVPALDKPDQRRETLGNAGQSADSIDARG